MIAAVQRFQPSVATKQEPMNTSGKGSDASAFVDYAVRNSKMEPPTNSGLALPSSDDLKVKAAISSRKAWNVKVGGNDNSLQLPAELPRLKFSDHKNLKKLREKCI